MWIILPESHIRRIWYESCSVNSGLNEQAKSVSILVNLGCPGRLTWSEMLCFRPIVCLSKHSCISGLCWLLDKMDFTDLKLRNGRLVMMDHGHVFIIIIIIIIYFFIIFFPIAPPPLSLGTSHIPALKVLCRISLKKKRVLWPEIEMLLIWVGGSMHEKFRFQMGQF